jgi:hypothetical protein
MLSGKSKSRSASGVSVRSSEQMLAYKPINRLYPGDQNMWVSTQQSSRQCGTTPSPSTRGRGRPARSQESPPPPIGRVTKEQLALQSRRRATTGHPPHSRLCGDLTHLQEHINSAVTALKRPKVCHVCGEPAYSKCGLCNVTLHYFSKRGANAGAECYLLYHSNAFFGLAKQDATLVNKRKQDWVFPTNAAKRGNATYICRLGADKAAANNSNNA